MFTGTTIRIEKAISATREISSPIGHARSQLTGERMIGYAARNSDQAIPSWWMAIQVVELLGLINGLEQIIAQQRFDEVDDTGARHRLELGP